MLDFLCWPGHTRWFPGMLERCSCQSPLLERSEELAEAAGEQLAFTMQRCTSKVLQPRVVMLVPTGQKQPTLSACRSLLKLAEAQGITASPSCFWVTFLIFFSVFLFPSWFPFDQFSHGLAIWRSGHLLFLWSIPCCSQTRGCLAFSFPPSWSSHPDFSCLVFCLNSDKIVSKFPFKFIKKFYL